MFSFFIVLDTQLIVPWLIHDRQLPKVGGKHSKFRFGVDDYCMAAISPLA